LKTILQEGGSEEYIRIEREKIGRRGSLESLVLGPAESQVFFIPDKARFGKLLFHDSGRAVRRIVVHHEYLQDGTRLAPDRFQAPADRVHTVPGDHANRYFFFTLYSGHFPSRSFTPSHAPSTAEKTNPSFLGRLSKDLMT
jgi:hypothetical protein